MAAFKRKCASILLLSMETISFGISVIKLICQRPRYYPFAFCVHCVDLYGWCKGVQPLPNDRNMPTQHIATLLGATFAHVWPPCWDVLRHVGCCWLKFENGHISARDFSQQHPARHNMS